MRWTARGPGSAGFWPRDTDPEVPIGRFTGGEVAWRLLVGLGRRRGAVVARSRGNLGIALRCLLLWVPVIGGAWLALIHAAGQPLSRAHWGVLLLAEVLALLVGGGHLWLHVKLGQSLARIEESAEALLVELGW